MKTVYAATRTTAGEQRQIAIASTPEVCKKLAQQHANFENDGKLVWTDFRGVPGASMSDIDKENAVVHYTIWPWTVAE